jgi:hypothetical protein
VNGSASAAGFYDAGVAVTVLVRGKRYAERRDEGIVIGSSFDNKRCIARVLVINHFDLDDFYDHILVVARRA